MSGKRGGALRDILEGLWALLWLVGGAIFVVAFALSFLGALAR